MNPEEKAKRKKAKLQGKIASEKRNQQILLKFMDTCKETPEVFWGTMFVTSFASAVTLNYIEQKRLEAAAAKASAAGQAAMNAEIAAAKAEHDAIAAAHPDGPFYGLSSWAEVWSSIEASIRAKYAVSSEDLAAYEAMKTRKRMPPNPLEIMPITYITVPGYAAREMLRKVEERVFYPESYDYTKSDLFNILHGVFGITCALSMSMLVMGKLWPKGSEGAQGSGSVLAAAAIGGLSLITSDALCDIGKES